MQFFYEIGILPWAIWTQGTSWCTHAQFCHQRCFLFENGWKWWFWSHKGCNIRSIGWNVRACSFTHHSVIVCHVQYTFDLSSQVECIRSSRIGVVFFVPSRFIHSRWSAVLLWSRWLCHQSHFDAGNRPHSPHVRESAGLMSFFF